MNEQPELLKDAMKHVKDIDRDNNGYVTNQELDDIFKLVFPSELKQRDLMKLFKPFSSIQNTILIDYKKFKKCIDQEISMLKSSEEHKTYKQPISESFNETSTISKDLMSTLYAAVKEIKD